jgi:hypothetical protein
VAKTRSTANKKNRKSIGFVIAALPSIAMKGSREESIFA